ncbi:DUF979 domain-containing protein [Burkholderia sp. Bp8963]|uniref:DUF979 domain-containing protein n=1 Tax=Burkholderia sp. Bp8963 TaxID=2184547 RepID=UPI000F5ABB24|nr:DUF979 domain-containing protein [Burkholderia sp. Bp8963]RQS71974.1 DUF979 domain-containing protein [Burkholderia sp. Bp8963]
MSTKILSVDYLFWLTGGLLAVIAMLILADRSHPRRLQTGSFWLIYALLFLGADFLPSPGVGALLVAMTLIAGFGGVVAAQKTANSPEQQTAGAARLGNRLFIPALTIPAVTIAGTFGAPHLAIAGRLLIDTRNATLVSFGLGCVLATILACAITRDSGYQAVKEGRRLTESLGWAVALPQLLGILGLVFAAAGVGQATSHLVTAYVPMDNRLIAVAVYCLGMASLTIVMGNAFAAFPVMTGGVGIPVLIGLHHANPAVVCAIGMFSGYSGTLLTPMAANFNIVPVALLQLPDKFAVIKAQAPTAALLLPLNILLMYWLAFG